MHPESDATWARSDGRPGGGRGDIRYDGGRDEVGGDEWGGAESPDADDQLRVGNDPCRHYCPAHEARANGADRLGLRATGQRGVDSRRKQWLSETGNLQRGLRRLTGTHCFLGRKSRVVLAL